MKQSYTIMRVFIFNIYLLGLLKPLLSAELPLSLQSALVQVEAGESGPSEERVFRRYVQDQDEDLKLVARVGMAKSQRQRGQTSQALAWVQEYADDKPENLQWQRIQGFVESARIKVALGQTYDAVSPEIAAQNPYWGIDGELEEKYGAGDNRFPDILTSSVPAENLYFRNAMLASVIPAMNLGVGGTPDVPKVEDSRTIELEQGATEGWPVDVYSNEFHPENSYWDHGNFQTIALPYVYHLYQRVIDEIKE